jgi:hypothetical protein
MTHNENADGHRETSVSLQELACLSGLGTQTVRRLVTLDIIEPEEIQPEPRFRIAVVERVRKMRRLHVELGVSWLSMPLVLQLLDRLDTLEAERRHTDRRA